jgi:hypothetical protein
MSDAGTRPPHKSGDINPQYRPPHDLSGAKFDKIDLTGISLFALLLCFDIGC